MRSFLFACTSLLAACVLDHDRDALPLPVEHDCAYHTATIFAPLDGAIDLAPAVETRVRWNQAGIPDRYISMQDDFGNFFLSSGPGEVQGDGSIIDHYTLPRGGTFTLEIGWFCDAGNDGPTIPLASARFRTK